MLMASSEAIHTLINFVINDCWIVAGGKIIFARRRHFKFQKTKEPQTLLVGIWGCA